MEERSLNKKITLGLINVAEITVAVLIANFIAAKVSIIPLAAILSVSTVMLAVFDTALRVYND